MKKISILIPLYNQELLIKKCLDSIPNREDIEIIVVDDCSTDNSYEVVSTYSNISLFKNEKNLGIGLTRNKLLDKAEGEYIFFLDSDDYLYTKEFLEVVDKLNGQVCLKPKCRRNDGHVWYSAVHRGDFLKRSFIGDIRHPDSRCGEDSCFKKLLNNKKGYQEERIDKVIYHYNEPRIDSLTWEHRKKKGIRGYDKGIDEWEKVYHK
jgi:glycosyltransferase involved in cell wall biosynthesis